MAKINSVTAIAVALFVIFLLLTLVHPFDFLNKDIEELYHENEGLIWIAGIGIGVGLMAMSYINSVYQNELKTCATENLEKNTTIEAQNKQIIKNQEKYILQMGDLAEKINKNYSQDNESMREMVKITEAIIGIKDELKNHTKQIKENRDAIKRLSEIDTRLARIEKKLT